MKEELCVSQREMLLIEFRIVYDCGDITNT